MLSTKKNVLILQNSVFIFNARFFKGDIINVERKIASAPEASDTNYYYACEFDLASSAFFIFLKHECGTLFMISYIVCFRGN